MKSHRNGLQLLIQETETELENYKKQFETLNSKRVYFSYLDYVFMKVKEEVRLVLTEFLGREIGIYDFSLVLPPPKIDADLVLATFTFSKELKKSPKKIAEDLAKFIEATKNRRYLVRGMALNGYLNIFLQNDIFYREVVADVISRDKAYGEIDVFKNQKVLIDYSAPNIAKPFGVGHLRSTVIGEALARIYNALGFSVIRDNHIGDWGTQFGSLIYAYKRWGDPELMGKNPIEELKNLYVKFTAEAEKDPSLKENARKLFAALENGDLELVALWKSFRDLSMLEFKRIYDLLNVKFDITIGESYYTEGVSEVVDDLVSKNLAYISEDGGIAVDLKEGLPSFLLKKSDGSTLYILRDILTLMHRIATFHPDEILYVVGSEQELNFRQLFTLCSKAGYASDTALVHVGFGLVLVNGKKMSTRKGTLVNLEDVLEKIVSKSKGIVRAKGKLNVEKISEVSSKIGVGALVYNDLKQNRKSDIDFNWEKMLSFESGSAVYLQYTYARIMSILKKVDVAPSKESLKRIVFENDLEYQLSIRLSLFSQVLINAKQENAPNLIALYLEELASNFNKLYAQVSFLKTDDDQLRSSRLCLLTALAIVIRNGLTILNVSVLEEI